ncbi:DUF397 domain-containing protein [Streptomyces tubbatahanensis]
MGSGSRVRRGGVPVRDSKDTARTPLAFSPSAWTAFVNGVKRTGR